MQHKQFTEMIHALGENPTTTQVRDYGCGKGWTREHIETASMLMEFPEPMLFIVYEFPLFKIKQLHALRKKLSRKQFDRVYRDLLELINPTQRF